LGGLTLPEKMFTVLDTVSALITPPAFAALIGSDDSLLLDGSASRTMDDTTRYQWRQVSGPALVFADAQGATTPVRLTGSGSGDTAVVELAVSNAAGETVARQLTLQTVPDPSVALYHLERYPASASPDLDIEPAPIAYPPKYFTDNGVLDVMVHTEGGADRFLIDFASTPVAGQRYAFGSGGGIVVMTHSHDGVNCWTQDDYTGHLDLLEFVRGPAGEILTLAFDVDGQCLGQPEKVSIRYRSTLPPTAALP
jgi:hypothetical protein